MSGSPERPVYEATLREELSSLGLWELLDDPALTDIIVNADGVLHTAGQNGTSQGDTPVSPSRLMSCIATIAGIHRRVIDERHPVLEVSLPYHHVRVTALVPPVTTGPVLALRLPPRRLLTLDDLEALGTIDREARTLVTEGYANGSTLLVTGSVGSGKTALASAVLDGLLRSRPGERLVVIEEGARELQLPERSNVSRLLTSDDDDLTVRDLVRISLRLNPDRIVLGELRGPEALDFVKAAQSGHPGLATLHAASARGALDRMADLIEEAGAPPSRARAARGVGLVVHMKRFGVRRWIDEIVRVGTPDATGEVGEELLYQRLQPPETPVDTHP